MRLCVDCAGGPGDIIIRTRVEMPDFGGHTLDIFARMTAPVVIAGWTFVVIPIGYTHALDFINDLTAPIVVTWSRDAVEAIPQFDGAAYTTSRISPYLIVTPGAAVWEISQDYGRVPRLISLGVPRPINGAGNVAAATQTLSRGGLCSEFEFNRGVTYVDERGATILANVLPADTKTARWLAGRSITYGSVIAEHIDGSRATAAAAALESLTEQLARAGGDGKSLLEREALLERRDILLTALESYDAEIRTIRVPVVRASAAELSRGLVAQPVPKPTARAPAPFTIAPAEARARLDEIGGLLAAPAPIIPPVVAVPRLIDVSAFDPAARAAAERYNETLRAEIARGDARAAEAKAARLANAARIELEAEAAKLKIKLASLDLAAQWERYREWKRTAGATAAEYEAAVAAEQAHARLEELTRVRKEHLVELLAVEREIGANRSRVSPEEYRALYSQYYTAREEHKAALDEYRTRGCFKTGEARPEDDRAAKVLALAKLVTIHAVVFKAPPRQLRELTAVIPHIFIVGYRAADWFLPTRDSPAGVYLGRLVPLPLAAPVVCACGKTYKNYRVHIESAAHKKWSRKN